MNITVNGTVHQTDETSICFEDGVRLGLWQERDTVTYRGLGTGRQYNAGTLFKSRDGLGKFLTLEEGMIFNAVNTGSA